MSDHGTSKTFVRVCRYGGYGHMQWFCLERWKFRGTQNTWPPEVVKATGGSGTSVLVACRIKGPKISEGLKHFHFLSAVVGSATAKPLSLGPGEVSWQFPILFAKNRLPTFRIALRNRKAMHSSIRCEAQGRTRLPCEFHGALHELEAMYKIS